MDDNELGKTVNGTRRGSYVLWRFWTQNGKLIFNWPEAGINEKNPQTTTRMELRGKQWRARTNSGVRYKTWKGDFRLPNWKNSNHSGRFAFGQLFAQNEGDAVGLVFRRDANRRGAVLVARPNSEATTSGRSSEEILLARITSESPTHRVRFVYDRRTGNANVYYNDVLKGKVYLNGHQSSGQEFYYKAGPYIQEAGKVRIEFSGLEFSGT